MARLPQTESEWRDLLCSLPGYDPFAQAGADPAFLRGDVPLDKDSCYFDEAAAARAIKFIECLKHVEGKIAGQPFLLERWQHAIIANLFGWKRPDGMRRYREVFIYVPRKNGKTPIAAAICLYMLVADGEAGAQVYGAAADKEQAGYLFRHASGMVGRAPSLTKKCKVYTALKSIQLRDDPASSYLVLSADADTKHGGNSHCVIIDELHAQPNRELVDVLTTSFASENRRQPLLLHITTADWKRESICNEKYKQACEVRDNAGDSSSVGFDPSFLPVIFEAGETDDWVSEQTWARANPNLGVSVSLDYLRRECRIAQEIPAKENTFRRLHLNQRTESDVRAIPLATWEPCGFGAEPVAWRDEMLAKMRGKTCICGLDLSAKNDLTAFVQLFYQERPMVVIPYFWATQDAVRRRTRDRVPYDVWLRQGFLIETPGNVIDYDQVRADIVDLAGAYPIESAYALGDKYANRVLLAVDTLFQALQLCNQLENEGLGTIEFRQGFFSMAMPTKRILEMIAGKEIDHGNNPALTWMAGNASTKEDPAGNLKFDKSKSGDKIDGIVALTMAVGLSEQVQVADAGMTKVEVW